MKLRGLTFTSARGSFCTLTSGLHLSFFVISRKYFCLLLIALSWGIHLQAQLPLKAKPLNVFVQPVLSEPYSIDVLSKSELGSCGVSNISIELFADPSRGTASVDPISKNILYKPNNDFSGQDSLKYKLTCGMENSVAVVLINIGNQPEVVIDDACAVIPAPMVWGIEEGVNLGIVHVYTPPLIGDLDGNKWPEVISSALNQNSSPIGHGGKRISIFKDGSADNRIDFTTVAPFQCFTPGVMAIAKVKVSEEKNIALIVVAEGDGILRAYKLTDPDDTYELTDNENVSLVWEATSNLDGIAASWKQPEATAVTGASVGFADFNQDGYAEVYCGGKIYDAATGRLLCSGAENTGKNTNVVVTEITMTVAADVCGDSKLELVAGNQVYEVDIDRTRATNLNSMEVVREVNPPIDCPSDGLTQVVDINNDGKLEVLVERRDVGNVHYIYLWDVETETVLAHRTLTYANAMGIPFIGDIDGCGSPEIVFIVSNYSNLSLDYCFIYALKYNESAEALDIFWKMKHADTSGQTGITIFDFNQDGTAEMVYRDEKLLRIMNGSGKDADGTNMIVDGNLNIDDATLKSYDNLSGTGFEYPVVADIDRDGQAEIIIGGKKYSGELYEGKAIGGQDGHLQVYKSSGEPWAPARPVWNQYPYNPVYVNDDLTIPQYPLNPATRFVDADGNYLQPFNNFLQQATLLNGEGKMLAYGPKLEYDNANGTPIQYTNLIPNTSVTASFTVINTGDADFKGPLDVSAYFLRDGVFEYITTTSVDGVIAKNDLKQINFSFNFSVLRIADPTSLIQIRLNDDGSGTPVSPLCSYFGTYSRPPFQAPDYFVRANTQNTIYFYPQSSGYIYRWYDKSPNVADPSDKPKAVGQGDSYSFTPKNTIKEFHVEIYNGNDLTTPIELYSSVTTICVPDSLVWTGNAAEGSQDWNDPKNWYYPNDPDPENTRMDTLRYKAPGIYTNVLIPGKLAASTDYPDLSVGKTSYDGNNIGGVAAPYDSAACDVIYFAHGGELLRTDLLSYNKACVDLTVQANRWYMFSPPLHNMYSGDFYRTTPNPFAASEQQTAYTMLYNAQNPEVGGSYQSGKWTGVFNNPDRPLYPGSGIAVWVDKHDTDYDEHPEISFAFPKNDAAHYLYNPLRPAENNANISSPPMPTPRSQSGRFIYENGDGQIAADGNITLQDMAGQKSRSILVGNPFMAHLDFNAFYEDSKNKAALEGNQYKLASGVKDGIDGNGVINTFYSYVWNEDGKKYISNDPTSYLAGESSGHIPPMQAFIINVTGDSVQANISHTVTSVADVDTFRNATSSSRSSGHLLHILATRGATVSKALILQGAAYSTNYLPSEDSYKLFVSGMSLNPETVLDVLKPVEVYTRSSDGYVLDINLIGVSEQDITVPLGIRTSEKGEIVLNFSGMESFGESTGIYLYDTQHPKRLIDLKTQPEYAFDKTEDTLYLENRLSLIIGKNTLARPLGLRKVSGTSAARIISQPHGMLRIVSENGGALGAVRITDSWGRTLLDVSAVSSSVYEYQTLMPGIYIVRVGAEVKRMISIW